MKRTRYDNEAVREATTVEAVSPKFKKRRQFDGKNHFPCGFYRIFPVFFLFFIGLMFPQNTSASLYDDFNISPSATQEEIEKAWKKRVRSYHPDKHINGEQGLSKDDAHEIFTFLNRNQTLEEIKAEDAPKLRPYKDLKTGFYILMDPTLREKYDEWLKTPDHEKNTGRFKHSAGRSDGRGSDSSGYSGNRAGRQSADNSGLLHAAILSADKISLSWSLSPKEKEEQILNIVKTVLEGNININGRDHYGKTALYVAIENSYFRIAEMLLSAGADPNIPDDHGRPPLHCISAGDSSDQSYSYYSSCSDEEIAEEALRLLVQFKADLSRRDSNDKTVIETAMESGFWNIAYMLLDQGAPYLTEEDREILSVMVVQNHQADILRLIRDPHTASGHGILQTRRPKQEQRRDPAAAARSVRDPAAAKAARIVKGDLKRAFAIGSILAIFDMSYIHYKDLSDDEILPLIFWTGMAGGGLVIFMEFFGRIKEKVKNKAGQCKAAFKTALK